MTSNISCVGTEAGMFYLPIEVPRRKQKQTLSFSLLENEWWSVYKKPTKEIMPFVFAGVWLGAESKKSLTSTPANVVDIERKDDVL